MRNILKSSSVISSIASGLLLFPQMALAQSTIPLKPAQGIAIPDIAITNIPQFIITLLLILAVIISIIFIIWGGIQWILSGGDKGKVEAARNHIVAAVIGLIVAFAAYFIIALAFGILGIPNPLQTGFKLPCLTNPAGCNQPATTLPPQ